MSRPPPPYHLRVNKAVDRFVMIEGILRLEQLDRLSEYTYYGMGGPYMEDFRILYEACKDIQMVSTEEKEDIFKRQHFHLPCSTVQLKNVDISEFIDEYESYGQKSIFWLDNTDLKYDRFGYFKLLLTKVAEGSVVKVTLRARAADYSDRPDEFGKEFGKLLRVPQAAPPSNGVEYAELLQDMLKVASQQALEAQPETMFQPTNSFFYSDGTGMLTLTGVVCSRGDEQRFQRGVQGLGVRQS